MIIVDDHLAVWALAGRGRRLWPGEVPAIPWGFHFRLLRALLDSRARGRLSQGTDERMVRAALAPPTDVLTVLDPRYLTVTAAQLMSRHRLSVVTSELLAAALVHSAQVHVAEPNVGRSWRHAFAQEGVALHIHPPAREPLR